MKEDIGMEGNDITKLTTVFSVGYIVGMWPSNLMVLIIRPRIFFPSCVLAWGLLTLGTYRVTTMTQLYIIRFFIGCFESSVFVGIHYCLGCWYKESELAKRSGIFTSSGLAGTFFSGFLQAAIYSNMNGLNGIAGWYVRNMLLD